MAKTIKFPLKLKDDFPARNLDELKQHFELEKLVNYFFDGKLLKWLEARDYNNEAESVKMLHKDEVDLHFKLCQIFNVDFDETNSSIDVKFVEKRNKKLAILRQYTSDDNILSNVDNIAFNQEELDALVKTNTHDIFLCGSSFVIPLEVNDKKYIGIGKVEAVINSNVFVDFDSKNVTFENILFDPTYDNIVPNETPEILIKRGDEAQKNKNYKTALEYYKKAAELGNDKAMYYIGSIYYCGHKNIPKDYNEAMKWYKKAAEFGYAYAMTAIGLMYESGYGVNQDYNKAIEWYKKAANLCDVVAEKALERLIY